MEHIRRLLTIPSMKPTSKDRFNSIIDVWQTINKQRLMGKSINFLLEFTDPEEQQSFMDFKAAQFGHRFFTFSFCAIVTIIFLLYWVIAMIKYPKFYSIIICAFTFGLAFPLMWTLCIVRQFHLHLSPRMNYWLENLFLMASTLCIGSMVLLRLGEENCFVLHFFYDVWKCAPVSVAFVTIFLPVICSKTMAYTSNLFIALSYSWSIIVVTWVTVDSGPLAVVAIPWLVISYGIVLLLQSINSWSHLQLYLYFLKIEDMQKQRDEDAARQAEEMRNLIGKIAHDIRTPLVAFSYGLDVMQGSMAQLQAAAPAHLLNASTEAAGMVKSEQPFQAAPAADSHSSKLLWSYVQTWSAALEGLQQSHLQLMMIIDRCMDYHKLSHGLPLIPKYAPTSISLVLDAVMNHAHRSLDSAQVKMERADVLGYVMTDPGWLQDNLLCLISNAIRFSSPRSPVIIRIIHCVQHACQEEQEEVRYEDAKAGALYHHHGMHHEHGSSNSNNSNNSSVVGGVGNVTSGDLEEGGQASTLPAPRAPAPAKHQILMVRIEVEDFGVGLTEEKLPTLFIPPEGSAERTVGGAGLGLYCLAERIKALHGDYGVKRKGIDPNAAVTSNRVLTEKQKHESLRKRSASIGLSDDELTRAHDGQHGSIFWFTLPLTSLTGLGLVSSAANSQSNSILMRRCADSVHLSSPERSDDMDEVPIEVGHDEEEALPAVETKTKPSSKESMEGDLGLPRKVSFSSQASLSSKSSGMRNSPSLVTATHRLSKAPMPTPPPSNKAAKGEHGHGMATAAQLFKDLQLRVLIVDDSPLILKMLKMMFLGKGHVVVTTTNGYEALSMLKQSFDDYRASLSAAPALLSASSSTVDLDTSAAKELVPEAKGREKPVKICFDAVLVDIQMPIIDGLEMMREYHKMLKDYQPQRNSASTSVMDAPSMVAAFPLIVAMSANTDHVTMQDSYTAGADHFLQKPFDIDTFYAVLLKHRRQRMKKSSFSVSDGSESSSVD